MSQDKPTTNSNNFLHRVRRLNQNLTKLEKLLTTSEESSNVLYETVNSHFSKYKEEYNQLHSISFNFELSQDELGEFDQLMEKLFNIELKINKIKQSRDGKAKLDLSLGFVDQKSEDFSKESVASISAMTVGKVQNVPGNAIQYASGALLAASVTNDTYRLYSAVKQDFSNLKKSQENIEKLENATEKLREALLDESLTTVDRQELEDMLVKCEKCLAQVRRHKNVPENSIKTGSSILGGWTVGLAGGYSGALAGTATGALVGAWFGPAGIAVGSVAGAVIGSISGAIVGGSLGSAGAELVAEKSLQKFVGPKAELNGDSEELINK